MDALAARKIKVDMQLVENTDFSTEATWQAMERLFSAKKPPEAVISFNDYIHLDVVAYAHHPAHAVPESVAFVSYANLPFNAHAAYPPAASLEQFPFVQGTRAMEILMQLLQQGTDSTAEQAFRIEEISPQLVVHP
jgi:DNA-binding LacI/PurR family transcriptional regulator